MTVTLTAQDRTTLRTAAYGAVSLLAAADAARSPHRVATHGAIALASATGAIGHVLAETSKIEALDGKSVAAIADQVLPALTAAMVRLKKQDAAEADNFRGTVVVALEAAARAPEGEPGPTVAEMTRKITCALDAA